jgi:hypothetical protein
MNGACSTHGTDEICIKPEGNTPLGGYTRQWEHNIKKNLTRVSACKLDSSGSG